MKLSKVLSLFIIFTLLSPSPLLLYADDTENDFNATKSHVNAIQISNPNLPDVPQQRGRMGEIMSRLFDADGKIGNWYLKALGTRQDGAVLRWSGGNGGQFVAGSMFDTGSNVSIQNQTTIGGNRYDAAGRLITRGTGKEQIILQTNDNNADVGIAFRNSGGAYTHSIYRTNIGSNNADLRIAGGQATSTIGNLDDYVTIEGGPSGGNVGIGLTDPGFKLDVSGDINFTGDLRKNGALYNPAGRFQDAATLGEIYYNGGFVGIGNNNPAQMLDVTGNANISGTLTVGNLNGDSITDASIDETELADGSVRTGEIQDGTIVNADINNAAAIAGTKISPNFGTQNISTTGNMGVGIAVPGSKLHVRNAADENFIVGTTDILGLGGGVQVSSYNNAGDTNLPLGLAGSYIGLGNSGQVPTVFVDNVSGQVGIGAVATNEKLTVFGRISVAADPDSSDDVGDRGYNDGRYINVGETILGDNIQDNTIDSSEIQNDTITEADISNSFIARDSQLLDGIDSTNFLRSDQNDRMNGTLQVEKAAGTLGSGYHIELRSPDSGDSADDVSILFHHLNRSWGQIRLNNAGFHFTNGNSPDLRNISIATPTVSTHGATKGYVDTELANIPGDNIQDNTIDESEIEDSFIARDSNLLDGIDSTSFVRDTGNESIGGIKTFTTGIQSFENSNTAGTNIKFGRDTTQYITPHGGAGGNFLTSISRSGNPKNFIIRSNRGTTNQDFIFNSNNGNFTAPGNIIADEPTVANHLTTKNYVDTLVTQGVTWKGPVEVGNTIVGTWGTCNASRQSWTTYNKNDNIIYICDGAGAWLTIGSTASIPYASTTNAGKIQISGDLQGTWNNITLRDGVVDSNAIANNSITASDIATNAVGNDELIDSPTFSTLNVTNGNGYAWENGVNRITHNDGGGNVQLRFGHDYSSSDERFTHGGSAFYIGGDLDSTTAGTASLQFKVSGNGGAGNDQAVTWGKVFRIGDQELTWNGDNILTDASGISGDLIVNGTLDSSEIEDNSITEADISDSFVARNSNLLDGIDSANFLRSDQSDTINGQLNFGNSTAFVRKGNDGEIILGGTIPYLQSGTSYYKIFHVGNDGAGSNLDADRLDGITSGSFLRSDAPDTIGATLTAGNYGAGNQILSFGAANKGIKYITDQEGVSFGSDSTVLIHAGDNTDNLVSDLGITAATTSEHLYLSSDGEVRIIAGRQSNYASSKLFSFRADGSAVFDGGVVLTTGSTIPGDSIQDGTVDSSEIQNNTLTASDLATNSVGNDELIDTPTITQLNVASGNDNGIRFWSNDNYEIAMGNSANYMYGPVQDYSIKMNMNNDNNRGWTWGITGQAPRTALDTEGHLQTAGWIRAEEGFRVDGTTVINGSAWLIGDRIQQNSIDSSEIQDNTLTANDLATNSVGNNELIDNPEIAELYVLSTGNPKLEMRDTDGGDWPYIDFSDDPTSDYDIRMRLDGSDQMLIEGGSLKVNDSNVIVDRDLYIGENGAGTSDSYFYDDNSNTWRGIRWNDGSNRFELEENNGTYYRVLREGHSGDYIADGTIDSSEIQNNTLTANDLAPNSVGNSELIDTPTFTTISLTDNNNLITAFSNPMLTINTGGSNSLALGINAGLNNTGPYQTAIGTYAGSNNTQWYVTSVGVYAGQDNQGRYGTFMGYSSGLGNTGYASIGVGTDASRNNTGARTLALGYEALENNTASNVVAIGYQAGRGNSSSNTFFVQQANVNSTPLMQGNFSSGNLGIGKNPGQKLDVNGNARAAAFLYSSDRRLKENITEYTNGIEVLDGIKTVSYDWKDKEKGNDVGVIAQDVQKVFPEAVKKDEEGYLSVDYARLVVPMINAIKEQQEIIDAQQQDIDMLKSKLLGE